MSRTVAHDPGLTARTSAVALVLMALGLGLLYHAGPWPWASRTLTLVGATLPAIYLARRLGTLLAELLEVAIVGCLVLTLLAGLLIANSELSYGAYAVATVTAQWFLVGIWALWLHASLGPDRNALKLGVNHSIGAPKQPKRARLLNACPVALLGILLAAMGATIATMVHFVIGQADPPAPWAPWRTGDYGPVDMVSRVWAELLPVEIGMSAVAVVVAVATWVWTRKTTP